MTILVGLVISLLGVMAVVLLLRALPVLVQQPLEALLASSVWHPSRGEFGFLPFLAGSGFVSLLAMTLAVPLALLSAIYLAEYSRLRQMIKPMIDLFASIPSVIYGLWGVLFVVPFIRDTLIPLVDRVFGPNAPLLATANTTGYSLLAGSIVVGIMVFPIIVSVTDELFRSVPQGMREAALALGATRWEVVKTVVLRRTRNGIVAAVVLGFSRAVGETLAVLMVVGNVAQVPRSIFDAAYPLPALIANNYGEMMSIPLYDSALMLASLLLLGVIAAFNLGAQIVLWRVTHAEAAT
ncbi:MAG: phosphate ABC transporter permease subunit PstC [Anaerolineae bacterium]|nr:phosphate ABC transporter permease subunit PstC [Anaerolineae bacterium]